jgi:hypothetical protein
MTLTAIDPGNSHSALIVLNGLEIRHRLYAENAVVRAYLQQRAPQDHMAIEMIASYGMAVGREVFDTCVWIGRFIETWGGPFDQVFRMDVKMALCHDSRAKDPNIRQALLDLYGGREATRKGGALHGITGDLWAALAVGVTWQRTKATGVA